MSRVGREIGREAMAGMYAILKMAGLPVDDLFGVTKKAAPRVPESATQLRLPLESRSGGRFVSPTRVANPEVVRASMQPRAVDVPVSRPRLRNPDQLNIPARSVPEPQWKGPLTRPVTKEGFALLEQDPGTYRAIQGIANRASRELGVDLPPEFFLRPDWSEQLRSIEAARSPMVRSGGSSLVPPGETGRLAQQTPGGALTRSPGGEVDTPITNLTFVRDITPGKAELPGGMDMRAAYTAPMDETPIDVAVRNAVGGIRFGDLSMLQKAGIGAVGLAGFGGITGLLNAINPGSEAPGRTPMGQPTATPDVGAVAPQVTGEEIPGQTSAPNFTTRLGAAAPSSAAVPTAPSLPTPVSAGLGTSAERTRSSEFISAVQNAKAASKMPFMPGAPTASNYPEIEDYYVQREKYAAQPSVKSDVAKQLAERDTRFAQKDIQQWAAANPQLAYELLQKTLGKRQLPSQQMPQARGAEITTSMGTNNVNNAAGSAAYSAASAVQGTQGAADIAATLTPRLNEVVRPLTVDEQRALAGMYTSAAGLY